MRLPIVWDAVRIGFGGGEMLFWRLNIVGYFESSVFSIDTRELMSPVSVDARI